MIGILVILLNIGQVPAVFALIFSEAFSMQAAAGGAGGYVMAKAMQFGITRGMYSNEAGEGTAPFAHGSSLVDHPCEEGITGVTEVFLDTIIICTITALVIGVTGIYQQSDLNATVMAISAFGTRAATESTMMISTAPERTMVSVISRACSPLSGWDMYRLSMSTPIFLA